MIFDLTKPVNFVCARRPWVIVTQYGQHFIYHERRGYSWPIPRPRLRATVQEKIAAALELAMKKDRNFPMKLL